ncbi:DNA polymerase-4 [Diaminobutyricimonas aerilata]|uniref:DNA polymerase IV n=1 Tax=Diaminobutyricimonas aerilata TaxID=1162967 RepID=A0A2M9CJV4_9MICO|nr:DNA polymerase IV [Diaminobutyricimonas aerilata]PJJ72181.1 DNA polymerase-4 [Diaminobutyricimonas aerilata]
MSKQDGRGRQVTTAPVDDPAAHVLHMDLDAFYASVELLDRPELRHLPVVIGHDSMRSVVTAANYVARQYGVNSAMPMSVALRKCPNAVILEPHFEKYSRLSGEVMEICRSVTPLVEQLSIDEAFLDVAGARRLLGTPYEIAVDVRRRVQEQTGLTCSIGVAATKFVAKLASSRSKPDGLLVVPKAETLDFLHPLPISALWGVGARTEEKLRAMGLQTVGDLARTPVETLHRWVGAAGGAKLHALAWARDPRSVETERIEKSVGHESTFGRDLTEPEQVHRELLRLSDQVGVRLRKHGVVGRTVSLKLRYTDFTTITRSRTLAEPTDLGRRIYEEVREVYDAVAKPGDRIRLVGVRMEQLGRPEGTALGLWDDDEAWRETETTIDAVAERFGRGAVTPAALLNRRKRDRPPAD